MGNLLIGRPRLVRLCPAARGEETKATVAVKRPSHPRTIREPDTTWTETKNYWVTPYEARSLGWFWARYGRLSGSHIGGALAWSRFSTPADTAAAIWGYEKALSSSGQYHTARGIRVEPRILATVARALGQPVENLPFIVSKRRVNMGYSCDGIVRVGDTVTNVEAKAPDYLPAPIAAYLTSLGWDGVTVPWEPKEMIPQDRLDYDHIDGSHYGQFQYGCDLLDATDNIYAVAVERTSIVYLERVPRDRAFAERMFGELDRFMDREYRAAAPATK